MPHYFTIGPLLVAPLVGVSLMKLANEIPKKL